MIEVIIIFTFILTFVLGLILNERDELFFKYNEVEKEPIGYSLFKLFMLSLISFLFAACWFIVWPSVIIAVTYYSIRWLMK